MAAGASWNEPNALAPGWGGSDGQVLSSVVVAGVYLALVVALLLAFGGPVRLHDLLRFRYYTSASDLRLALGIRVLCWAAIALAYGVLSPELGPPQDALLQLCPPSTPTCPAFRPPSRSRSARSLLGRVF